MDMEAVIRQLQDTATVMAGIQARQAAALKEHSIWLEEHEKSMTEHRLRMERIEANLADGAEKMKHIETNLVEATDKLNGLISFVDDMTRRRGKDL
jgi:hypothetical protein